MMNNQHNFNELTPQDIIRQLIQVQNTVNQEPLGTLIHEKTNILFQKGWNVQWQLYSEVTRTQLFNELPKWIGFYTSGHTKKPKLWLRKIKQLFEEVKILSEICQIQKNDGIITFAPVHHLYGLLLSFLLPAKKGLPVWFFPMKSPSSLKITQLKNPLFVTIPSALTYLERRIKDLADYHSITIVYSTALLPKVALRVLKKLNHKPVDFFEFFGSTETGIVAGRTPKINAESPWILAKDVTFVNPNYAQEAPLKIYSPRLAYDANGVQLTSWQLDDFVKISSPNTFSFCGRRSRLVKINGRRVNLDWTEQAVREILPCQDLACVPVRDDVRGENFDLLVVPAAEQPLEVEEIREKCQEVLTQAEQPRKVLLIPKLDRTATGKLRKLELST